jgi:hypothetical protein
MADKTTVRASWNLFSPQQDIELGRNLADQAQSSFSLVDHHNANTYLAALGSQLVVHAPGEKYPYQFRIVDDRSINALALPGGYVYVYRGAIETAQNEPQLAGLLAHEIAHVVLRHGTQQVSRAYAAQVPNAAPGRVSVRTVLNRLDIGVDSNSTALKYSREAERQADLIATQIMVDAGFDPQNMVRFFRRMNNQSMNLRSEFVAAHPEPANRAGRIRTEVQNMGGLRRNLRGDSPDFHSVKETLLALNDSYPYMDRDSDVDLPSSRTVLHREGDIEFRYPANWKIYESGNAIDLAPDGGIVSGSLAYGMRIATFDPGDSYRFGQRGLAPSDRTSQNSLSRATDRLIEDMRSSNPNMRVVRRDERRQVDGQPSMTIEFTNDSPFGGSEVNWLVSVIRPTDGMLQYFVGVAPQRDYNSYASTFERIVSSVRFVNYY